MSASDELSGNLQIRYLALQLAIDSYRVDPDTPGTSRIINRATAFEEFLLQSILREDLLTEEP